MRIYTSENVMASSIATKLRERHNLPDFFQHHLIAFAKTLGIEPHGKAVPYEKDRKPRPCYTAYQAMRIVQEFEKTLAPAPAPVPTWQETTTVATATAQQLVDELRGRGYSVTATRTETL